MGTTCNAVGCYPSGHDEDIDDGHLTRTGSSIGGGGYLLS